MTKPVKAVTPSAVHSASATADPESLDQLRGDCARMAQRFASGRSGAPDPGKPSDLHGITVPAKSAALVDGMPEYGD
ncbi:hypothetical protein [Streptomyces chattanoogensis]|uniref:Uncharacterized protein n=1 Tax=Streptomyces chattanoogensis TaxID=66876 RepID=A0A0N0XS85_9ACTN|nr:hypothetical protein [Streptomyces chattanoogensis]KPC60618.1 hypothetical protein ADL29_28910 [Streptomyces chattanoogensis]